MKVKFCCGLHSVPTQTSAGPPGGGPKNSKWVWKLILKPSHIQCFFRFLQSRAAARQSRRQRRRRRYQERRSCLDLQLTCQSCKTWRANCDGSPRTDRFSSGFLRRDLKSEQMSVSMTFMSQVDPAAFYQQTQSDSFWRRLSHAHLQFGSHPNQSREKDANKHQKIEMNIQKRL